MDFDVFVCFLGYNGDSAGSIIVLNYGIYILVSKKNICFVVSCVYTVFRNDRCDNFVCFWMAFIVNFINFFLFLLIQKIAFGKSIFFCIWIFRLQVHISIMSITDYLTPLKSEKKSSKKRSITESKETDSEHVQSQSTEHKSVSHNSTSTLTVAPEPPSSKRIKKVTKKLQKVRKN